MRLLFWIIAAVYVLTNLISLSYFPLPWQDEVYNASITRYFQENGSFVPQVVYYTTGLKNDIRYGPVFFMLTSLPAKLFGSTIYSIRMISFLSGLGVIFICFKILSKNTYRKGLMLLFVLLLAFDPYFIRCMHEGRMELTALLFLLLGYYYGIVLIKSKKLLFAVVTSAFLSLSLLTTPRVGFLILGFIPLLYGFVTSWIPKKWKYLVALLVPFVGLYSLWIFYVFGSYSNFIEFYTSFSDGYTQLGGFYFYLQKNQYILIPLVLFSCFIGFFSQKKEWLTSLNLTACLSIAGFYLIVKDPGPYAVYITPLFYILLISPLQLGSIAETEPPVN